MSILISQNFKNGYIKNTKGNGSINYVSDTIVQLNSPYGNNRSLIEWYFLVESGSKIEFEILARNIKGSTRIALDLLNENLQPVLGPYVWKEIKGSDFKNYKIKTRLPLNENIKIARLTFGAWDRIEEETQGEFTLPRLSVSSSLGNLQTIACGLLHLSNNKYILHDKFKNFGFEGFEYDQDKKELKITLERRTHPDTRVLIQASGTMENPYIPVAGKWNNDERSFIVKVSNGSEFLDINSLSMYVNIEVKG